MKLHVQITRCILARCRVCRFVVAFEHICEFAESSLGLLVDVLKCPLTEPLWSLVVGTQGRIEGGGGGGLGGRGRSRYTNSFRGKVVGFVWTLRVMQFTSPYFRSATIG